jgi:hypothetical protein
VFFWVYFSIWVFSVLLGVLKKNEWKKLNPLILWEKIKCRDNEKIIMCWFFVKKKECYLWCFFREDSFRDIIRGKKRENLSMIRAIYQAANVIKAWWSLCQWSSKNRWVKPTWAMTHDSLYNECQDKRTSNIMRCFARSMRRSWEDVVWSRGVSVDLTYTWPEESDKLDGIWDETMIDFLNFLDQWIEKKLSMDGVAIRYELWRSTMMI